MGNTVAKGSTYKDKMNELELEIAKLEDEIDKLRAQKRVTSLSAYSGEFLHRNIAFAIQYIDKAPPEAQKSLIQALIRDILVYSDRIVINMYIEEPLEDILPRIIPSIKEKRPTDLSAEAEGESTSAKAEACKALVPTAPLGGDSASCQHWLPKVVASRVSQHLYCQILIKMTIRCGKGGFIYLGDRLT